MLGNRIILGHHFTDITLPARLLVPVPAPPRSLFLCAVAQALQTMGYSVTVHVRPDNSCQTKAALMATAASLR